MNKLCLGTVQFGMDYGINNSQGKPSKNDVFEILDIALNEGIVKIDTAAAYGNAEEILGEYLSIRRKKENVEIISKTSISDFENGEDCFKSMKQRLETTLRHLHLEYLDGYLLHSPNYIYNKDVIEALGKLKEQGLTKNIGVSIYNMEEGWETIKSGVFDYIQLPYSIFDQRGIRTGLIHSAKERGMKIYTRSIFLQGLYFMDTKKIPKHLLNAVPYLEKMDELVKQYSVDKMTALIHFVAKEAEIDYLVFGVESKNQLKEYISKYKKDIIPDDLVRKMKQNFIDIEEDIILPSLWRKKIQ